MLVYELCGLTKEKIALVDGNVWLPEAELALVERKKVLGFLLNRANRYGLTGDKTIIASGPDQ